MRDSPYWRGCRDLKQDKNLTWHPVDAKSLNLKGMRIAIVSGTGGIRRALRLFVALRGASVLVVCRTFRDSDLPEVEFIKAVLSLLREAKCVAALMPADTLDLCTFTTGIMAAPKRQGTVEGIKRDMAVSYLSRLVLVGEITPRLGKNRPAAPIRPRAFIWGFSANGQTGNHDDLVSQKSYSSMTVHMDTVAGNEMLVLDAARRYPNASFFGMNPGLIETNSRSDLIGADTLRYRFIEWMIGLMSLSGETYAERHSSSFRISRGTVAQCLTVKASQFYRRQS